MDLLGRRTAANTEHLARVKGWVRELLPADAEATVLVTELHCTEPGCPPVETVIALLSADGTRQHKVHAAIADVTREHIAALALQARPT
jgi:hypothetical protein